MGNEDEWEYLKVKLESQKMFADSAASCAMRNNDENAYYTLDMLRLELGCCVARVQDILDLLKERAKVVKNDGV